MNNEWSTFDIFCHMLKHPTYQYIEIYKAMTKEFAFPNPWVGMIYVKTVYSGIPPGCIAKFLKQQIIYNQICLG